MHTYIHSHPTAWISTVAEAQTNLMLTLLDSLSAVFFIYELVDMKNQTPGHLFRIFTKCA